MSKVMIVGAARDARTRTKRAQAGVRTRKARIAGVYRVRPNRTLPFSLEQCAQHREELMDLFDAGLILFQDSNGGPMSLKDVFSWEGQDPMPDLSDVNIDDLVVMFEEEEDPPLLAHIKITLIERVVAEIAANDHLDHLVTMADAFEEHPMAFDEIKEAYASRIQELRDALPDTDPEDPPESEIPETATAEDVGPGEIDDPEAYAEALADGTITEVSDETAPAVDVEASDLEAEGTDADATELDHDTAAVLESADDTESEDAADEEGSAEADEEDLLPYAEWDYSDIKAEVKARELESDSQKKEDLVAALELDDESDEEDAEG